MKNNLKLLRLLFRSSPLYCCGYCVNVLLLSLPQYLVSVLFLKYILDSVTAGKPPFSLLPFLAVVGAFLILSDIYSCYFTQVWEPKAKEKLEMEFYNKLYSVSSRISLSYYDDPKFYSEYIFVQQNIMGTVDKVMNGVAQIIAGTVNVILILRLFGQIGAALFAFAVLSAILTLLFQLKGAKLNHQKKVALVPLQRKRGYFFQVFFERDAAKDRKLSEIDSKLRNEYHNSALKLKEETKRVGFPLAIIQFLAEEIPTNLLLNFGLMAFLVYEIAVERKMTIGDFTASFNGVNTVTGTMGMLFASIAQMKETGFDLGKYFHFMSLGAKNEGTKPMPQKPQKLEFADVSFAYPNTDKLVLEHINLKIRPGEKVAIVGENGAGKSTLASVLMGFYPPTEGEIKVADAPLTQYDIKQYQQSFGAFFQKEKPISAKVAENVALDVDYDVLRVRETLAQSNLEELIGKEELLIGREFDNAGLLLSGGQSAKLMIAHCCYQKKPYYVFDEPSAALDPISEFKLNRQLACLSKDSTVIFITHRLSTVQMADRILVLDKGKIIEDGSHEQLLAARDSQYAKLWDLQARYYLREE